MSETTDSTIEAAFPVGTWVTYTDAHRGGSSVRDWDLKGKGVVTEFTPYGWWSGKDDGAPHPGGGWYTLAGYEHGHVRVDASHLALLPVEDIPTMSFHHDYENPWPTGTRLTRTTYDGKTHKRIVTVVAYEATEEVYTLRSSDGTELDVPAGMDELTLAPAPKKAGARKPKDPNKVKVVKPDKATLPRIIAFDSFYDSGEYGNANCPHCGALGRYSWTFHCSDGTKRGAMAGCIQLFKVSPIAAEHKKLLERMKDRAKSGGKLASWDVNKLAAIDGLVAGTVTEGDCLRTIEVENAKRARWIEGRNGNLGRAPRRRW